MNAFSAAMVINLGVLVLTGFVFHETGSWWSLIILLAMNRASTKEEPKEKEELL